MRIIRSNSELESLHSAGVGFIYNDFSGRGSKGKDYNVLHTASCSWVVRSNVNVPKYFFSNIDEAIKWLLRNRGGEGKNWKRCGTCKAEARPLSQVSPETKPVDKVEQVPVPSKVFTEKEAEKFLIKHARVQNEGSVIIQDPRVKCLLEFGKTIRPRQLFSNIVQEAALLIEENPFAFALAAVLDRGTKSEIIWTIPYYLKTQVGNLDPQFFARKSIKELGIIFRKLPAKPRYINDAPRTVKELSEIIVNEYGGDATKMWRNRTSTYVKATFERIYGVGLGISSMIVLLLERCYGVQFDDLDHKNMNVKSDIHIVRVFSRLGFISQPSEKQALKAAIRFNPEYPGALDPPTWIIGKTWCTSFSPKCGSCPLDDVCPKISK